MNDENLPIALHHGSLAAEQRRKVEAAMGRGELRAVVCTSTLDLGIDWGAVDLVIQLGRAQGLLAADPAHRPRQPPAGRAQPAPCRCRPTASRCWNAQAAQRGGWPRTTWTASRSASAPRTSWPSTSWAAPAPSPFDPMTFMPRLATAGLYRRPVPRGLRPGGGFRLHRRLRAEDLRPLQAHRAGPRRPVAGAEQARPPSATA